MESAPTRLRFVYGLCSLSDTMGLYQRFRLPRCQKHSETYLCNETPLTSAPSGSPVTEHNMVRPRHRYIYKKKRSHPARNTEQSRLDTEEIRTGLVTFCVYFPLFHTTFHLKKNNIKMWYMYSIFMNSLNLFLIYGTLQYSLWYTERLPRLSCLNFSPPAFRHAHRSLPSSNRSQTKLLCCQRLLKFWKRFRDKRPTIHF